MLYKNKFYISSLELFNQTSSSYSTLLNIFSCLHFPLNAAKPAFKHTYLQRVSQSYNWIFKSALRQVWQLSYSTVGWKVEFRCLHWEKKLLEYEFKLWRSTMNHRVYQNKFALPIVTEELRYRGPKLGTLAFPITESQNF